MAKMEKIVNVLPTEKELLAIPVSRHMIYSVRGKEAQRIRTRLYAINSKNAVARKFRTMLNGSELHVLRLW